MTYLAAERKLRKEYGIDLRTITERQDKATQALIEQKKTEKKAAFLVEKLDHALGQRAGAVVHSAYATGPVMGMERVSWPEAQRRLREAGVEL